MGVAGVTFGIFDEEGNKIEEITTDSNGYAKSSPLTLDIRYIVKELKTRDEYIINNNEYRVDLTENGVIEGYTYTLRILNEHKKGNLHVEKITLDDKTIQMGNVKFELYLVGNGEIRLYIGTYYTDVNGEIYIPNLNTGNYMLKETETNRWYYLKDDTTIEVKWSRQYGDTNVTIENEKKKGIIKIIKTDKDFQEHPLEGIEFEVYDEDNNYIETITTSASGIAESRRLRIDKKYYVKETKTLENYILDDNIYTIDFVKGLTKDEINNIQKDTIYELPLTNEHKKGNLKVYKVDADDNTIPLENVKFELYAKNVDSPYIEDGLVDTYITNEQGEITINDMWTGEWYLKEVETNIFYKLNKENSEIEIKHNETTEITIENEPKKGYITIEKQDSEFNDIKIPKVVFNINDEDANFIETVTTDEKGIAQSSLLPIQKTYYVVEVETNNLYKLTNEFFRVNFIENKTLDEIAEIETDIEYSFTVENEAKESSLKIIKVDMDNNEICIPNAEFEIKDETLNKVIATVRTNTSGVALIENLKVTHTYSAREVKSNYKYKLNKKTITNIVLNPDNVKNITVENELLKGQIKVIKVDLDDNEIKLEGVSFEILDENMNVVEEITTDSNGEALSSRLPCVDREYYIREKETLDTYVLSDEVKKVTLTADKITDLTFKNEKIKGYIQITKTSADDNPITGETAGTPIANVEFEIYDSDGNIVSNIITNEKGIAITDKLIKGKYTIKEKKSGKFYQLNMTEYNAEIEDHLQIVNVDITNESDNPNVDIEKTGIIQTTANQEIRYDFKIKNTGNVPLDNFTWYDYLPTEYVKITKLITGTYNQDLNYSIYYKTNLNDYKLLAENLNTQINNYIDFSNIQLEEGEIITEFKADFGTVGVGFESVINPYIFVKVNSTVKDDDTFTNKTRIEGKHESYLVWDEDDHTTKVYEKEIIVKKLPRTGF